MLLNDTLHPSALSIPSLQLISILKLSSLLSTKQRFPLTLFVLLTVLSFVVRGLFYLMSPDFLSNDAHFHSFVIG